MKMRGAIFFFSFSIRQLSSPSQSQSCFLLFSFVDVERIESKQQSLNNSPVKRTRQTRQLVDCCTRTTWHRQLFTSLPAKRRHDPAGLESRKISSFDGSVSTNVHHISFCFLCPWLFHCTEREPAEQKRSSLSSGGGGVKKQNAAFKFYNRRVSLMGN